MSDSSPKPPGGVPKVKTLTYGARVEDVLREKEPDAVNDDDVLLLKNETQEPESPNIVKINEPEVPTELATDDVTIEIEDPAEGHEDAEAMEGKAELPVEPTPTSRAVKPEPIPTPTPAPRAVKPVVEQPEPTPTSAEPVAAEPAAKPDEAGEVTEATEGAEPVTSQPEEMSVPSEAEKAEIEAAEAAKAAEEKAEIEAAERKANFEKLCNDLNREMADYAGVVFRKGGTRPLITKVLAKVVISKELDVMAADVRFQDGKDRKPGKFAGKIRDGIYLVLKGEKGKFPKFFMGRHADKLDKKRLQLYFDTIQNEDDFDQLSREEMREADIQELKENLDGLKPTKKGESIKGDLLDCKALDDGLLAKVLIQHEQEGETREKSYLVLHGANGTTSFGGQYSIRVKDETVDEKFGLIDTKEAFVKHSQQAEERGKQLFELENMVKESNGELIVSKELDDCVIAKVQVTHNQNGKTLEIKYLLLKNGKPGISTLGGENAWKVMPGMVDAFFDEIINSDNFETISELVEGSLDDIEQRRDRLNKGKAKSIGKTEAKSVR